MGSFSYWYFHSTMYSYLSGNVACFDLLNDGAIDDVTNVICKVQQND